jgi:hypothetical protein
MSVHKMFVDKMPVDEMTYYLLKRNSADESLKPMGVRVYKICYNHFEKAHMLWSQQLVILRS